MSGLGILMIVMAAALLATVAFLLFLVKHNREGFMIRHTAGSDPLHITSQEEKQGDCFHGDR